MSDHPMSAAGQHVTSPGPQPHAGSFFLLAENLGAIVTRHDRALRYIYVNPSHTRATGFPPQTVLGNSVREVGFPEAYAALWEQELAAVFETARERRFDFECTKAERTRRFTAHLIPEIGPDGKCETVLGISYGIGLQTWGYQSPNRAKFDSLLRALPDPVFEIDRNGTFLDFKPGHKNDFAIQPEQVLGKTVGEVLTAEPAADMMRVIAEALRGTEVAPLELQLPHAAGELRHYEVRVAMATPDTVFAVVRDITERKRAEDEMRHRKKLHDAIIDNLPVGVFIRDAKTSRYLMRNRFMSERSGYPVDDPAGKTIYDLFPKGQADRFSESDREALATGRMVDIPDCEVIGRAGGVRIHQVRKVPLFDEHGEPWLIVGISEDITERKRAEEALAYRQKMIDTIIEHLPVGIIIKDARTRRYITRNPMAAELTGITHTEAAGKSPEDIYPRELADLISATDREALATRTVVSSPPQGLKHGTGRVVRYLKFPVPDETGEFAYLVSIFEDLTAIQQAQADLAGQKRLLDAVIEHLPVGLAVKDARTRRYVLRNRLAAKLTGVDSAEAIGKCADEVYPRDLAERIDILDGKVLASGAPVIVSPAVVQHRTGHVVRNVKVPVPDETGRHTHLISILEDLTEIEQAQTALNRSEERLRQLISMSPAAIFSLSLDAQFAMTFVSENVTAQVGWRPPDFTENPSFWSDHVHPHDREAAREHVAKLATDGKYLCEYRFRHKDGSWRWMRDEATVICSAAGTPVEGVGVWIDITEAKQREGELRAARDGLERRVAERTQELAETVNALKAAQARLRSLATHQRSVLESERTRIARDLHDGLGSALTAMRIDLAWLGKQLARSHVRRERIEQLKVLVTRVDEAMQTVRRVTTELRPSILDHLGLWAALDWLAQEFRERHGIPCELEQAVPANVEVSAARATAVFRIVQEALTNVVRHAFASRVIVRTGTGSGSLVIKVIDDGRGAARAQLANPRTHGIVGMQERAAALGGSLSVVAIKAAGTSVELRLPLDAPRKAKKERRKQKSHEPRAFH